MIGKLPKPISRPAVAIAMAGLLTAFAVPVAASAAAEPTRMSSQAARLPVPALDWHSCDSGFQCATARVPLDYRQPQGATISIAVIKHDATDPAKRLGSLFVNGGGPAAQVAGFPGEYSQIPAAVRERFDVITFDPRGWGYSTAAQCFASVPVLPPFPVGAMQVAEWDQSSAKFDALCAKQNGSLLDHDTTADVARDMNLLREAVGAPVLNYWGLSYGTALGAVYANLFPATTGQMILDGNVNPAAWSSGTLPVFMRLQSGQASAAAMTGFLDLCGKATTADCAFSAGSPAATRAKWNTLLSRVLRHPVTIGSPPQTYTYADVVETPPLGIVQNWPAGAVQLQQLWVASAASPGTSKRAVNAPAAAPAVDIPAGTPAVLCPDTDNPRDVAAYTADAKLAYAEAGGFGLFYAWTTEECADWADGGAPDRYTGPWNRPTASTILVLGNTGDPQLPYADSVAMSRELARARLLTIDGYGHTEALNPSTCAIGYETSYLLTGALPPAGTVCEENLIPFSNG